MPKPRKYHELAKILRSYDKRFEFSVRRAKGSERMIYHPNIDGRPVATPVKCHGKGSEIGKGAVKEIIRRFKLPKNLL